MHTVLYRVKDDNIAEHDEILSLYIVQSLSSNQIPVEYAVQTRVNVTIVDNDSECVNVQLFTCMSECVYSCYYWV